MNVMLIYPAPDERKSFRFGYSLLLLYIASELKLHEHYVKFYDFSVEAFPSDSFKKDTLNSSVAIIDIDAFPLKRSTNLKNAENIALFIRKTNKNIKIIAVGKLCTLLNKSFDFVDITIAGDSEVFIPKILNDIKCDNFKGFYNAGRILDLSILPQPMYDLLPQEQITGKYLWGHMHIAPSALLETSRGCPGHCSFCQRKGWQRRGLTLSLKQIEENIAFFLRNKIKNIWITDENFFGNLEHAKVVLKTFTDYNLSKYVKIAISSWAHINEEILIAAKSAGISIISFGIESITQQNQSFYKKYIDIHKLSSILKCADNIGIFTIGNFIIGSPYDTEQTIRENLSWALSSHLDSVNVKILDYMRGSELFETLHIDKKDKIHFFSTKELGLSNFTLQEAKDIATEFKIQVEKRRSAYLKKKIEKFGYPYYIS